MMRVGGGGGRCRVYGQILDYVIIGKDAFIHAILICKIKCLKVLVFALFTYMHYAIVIVPMYCDVVIVVNNR